MTTAITPFARLQRTVETLIPVEHTVASFSSQHRTGRRVRGQITENKLDRVQHHLSKLGRLKQRRCVSHGAVEDAARTVGEVPGQRAVRIIDFERRLLDLARAALRTYQVAKFGYIHRSIAAP
jgi:hypothetical protein